MAKSVLDGGDPTDDVQGGQGDLPHRDDVLGHVLKAQDVGHLRPLLLRQTNGGHLGQTALDGSPEGCMTLHPVEQDDPIALIGVLVYVHRQAPVAGPNLHHLHGGEDGRVHGLLGDAVVVQDLPLTFGGGAAVAAHSGDQDGLAPPGPDEITGCADQQGVFVHPPAPAGDRDPLAGLDVQSPLLQLRHQHFPDVLQLPVLELLPDLDDIRQFYRV